MPMHMHTVHRRVCGLHMTDRCKQSGWLRCPPSLPLPHPLSIDQLTSRSLSRTYQKECWTDAALRLHTLVQPTDSLGWSPSLSLVQATTKQAGALWTPPRAMRGTLRLFLDNPCKREGWKGCLLRPCGSAAVFQYYYRSTAFLPRGGRTKMAPTQIRRPNGRLS